MTVLNIIKIFGPKEAAKLVHRWQQAAHRYVDDLILFLEIQIVNASTPQGNNKVLPHVSFDGLFLGGVEKIIQLVRKRFPELGLERDDCSEMRWIEYVLCFAGFTSGQSPKALANRTPQIPQVTLPFKGKSDFVTKPIPEKALESLVRRLYEVDVGMAFYQFEQNSGSISTPKWESFPYHL